MFMDGHDDDSNKTNGGAESNARGSFGGDESGVDVQTSNAREFYDGDGPSVDVQTSSAQGIFSTPELTVDTEKIAQNQKSDRSRMASIFANTEAGQRSQKLNDAMGISTQPLTPEEMQPTTEDAASETALPRKRNKKPFIIVLILVLVVGVGVGVYLLINNFVANTQISQINAFNEYYDYLKNGPEGGREAMADINLSESVWYFSALNDLAISDVARTEYYDILLEKFNRFKQVIETQSSESPLKDGVMRYSRILELTVLIDSITSVNDTLQRVYLASGAEAAYAYVSEIASANGNTVNEFIASVSQQLENYLNKELALVRMSENGGCYLGAQIDYTCQNDLAASNTTFKQTYSEQQLVLKYLDRSFTELQQVLQSETEQIQEILGAQR